MINWKPLEDLEKQTDCLVKTSLGNVLFSTFFPTIGFCTFQIRKKIGILYFSPIKIENATHYITLNDLTTN